jgi:hypothetical protein
VAKEKRVDGAVDVGEAKAGDENVFELFPEKCGVEIFVGHVFVVRFLTVHGAES